MSNTLDRIISDKRNHIAIRKTQISFAELEDQAKAASPVRGFKAALDRASAEGRYGLIAEVKKGSPSKGLIRPDFDPPSHARAYQAGGASCLSVLTDEPYFMGADSYLVAARAEVNLPVLRKDFMIDPWQVTEARALGADCILLIVACLDLLQMQELEAAAFDLEMDVLVEVHNPAEMEEALQLRTELIGINNRNLKTLQVDLSVARDYASMVPATHRLVGESGLSTKADLDALAEVGVTSFLVGESLMRQADVEAATRRLLTGA